MLEQLVKCIYEIFPQSNYRLAHFTRRDFDNRADSSFCLNWRLNQIVLFCQFCLSSVNFLWFSSVLLCVLCGKKSSKTNLRHRRSDGLLVLWWANNLWRRFAPNALCRRRPTCVITSDFLRICWGKPPANQSSKDKWLSRHYLSAIAKRAVLLFGDLINSSSVKGIAGELVSTASGIISTPAGIDFGNLHCNGANCVYLWSAGCAESYLHTKIICRLH